MLSKKLNIVLSSLQLFYQNLRSAHWLVRGDMFFEMHSLYQTMYEWTDEQIDDVAELILSIEEIPLTQFNQYEGNSDILYCTEYSPKEIGKSILANLVVLNRNINDAHNMSELIKEKPICLKLTEIQAKLQKWYWQFRAYLDVDKD